MKLGEKLRSSRLEAGLSQRQLCGDEITRNMLSQIEHGTAMPSMKTLQYLAGKLGKSVSYFLDETAVVSPNQEIMEAARQFYDEKDYVRTAQTLEGYRAPDPVYDREKALLWVLTHLALAEQARMENRERYALELLEKADIPTAYCGEALNRRRLLLMGRISGQQVCQQLPSLDEELMLRAKAALSREEPERAVHLLEAMEQRNDPYWYLLRGESCLAQKNYAHAAQFFHAAEEVFPKETAPKLELCYRELNDFKRAYEYACKQKNQS